MIYSKGTSAVTLGSATVIGTGTKWLKRVHIGDVFQLNSGGSLYLIANIISNTEIRLSAKYGEASNGTAAYVIVSDFSRYYSIPYPNTQDVSKASILKRSIKKIDKLFGRLNDRIFLLEYPPGSVVNITSVPSITTVYIQPTVSGLVTADSNTVTADSNTVTADGATITAGNLITADSSTVTADANNVTADGKYTP